MTKTEINSELNEIKDKKDSSIVFNQDFNNHSDWKCRLFGIDNFFFVPEKGKEPNIFWRTVQYLLIGNKWSKTDVDGWKHAKYFDGTKWVDSWGEKQ